MSKTELMVLGLDDFSKTIQGKNIISGNKIKILGSFLDSKLSWAKTLTTSFQNVDHLYLP